MEPRLSPLTKEDPFRFNCSETVPCYNTCCRDLNQFLTPFDILRLKQHLRLTSTEFLRIYTRQHMGPQTGLPVISLRPQNDAEQTCPFVSPSGCRVYPNRPTSCRLYPIARAITRCPQSGVVTEHYALLKEAHCHGFDQNKSQTIDQWLADQGVQPYLAVNDRFLDIISEKNRCHPGPLSLSENHLFQMALYDLDRYRIYLRDNRLLEREGFSAEQSAELEHDDLALLLFAHSWIKTMLFENGT